MAMCAHVTVDSSADACGGRCGIQLILLAAAAAGSCGYVRGAAADTWYSTTLVLLYYIPSWLVH